MTVSIEFLNELVDRFTLATAANYATAGRRGCIVHLTPETADAVLLAGDLHGNRENFHKLLKAAKLEKNPRRHLILQEVIHGGALYPNGGDMSHILLEDVAQLKAEFPERFHFLLCNHELAECISQPLVKGGVSQNLQYALGLEHAYGPASHRLAECFQQFILSCPLAIRLSNGVFISHSLPDKKRLPHFDVGVFAREPTRSDLGIGGSAHSLVWGRDYDADHVKSFLDLVGARLLLTGHEPIPEGYKVPNDYQIIFDCSGPQCWACVAPVQREYTVRELVAKLHKL